MSGSRAGQSEPVFAFLCFEFVCVYGRVYGGDAVFVVVLVSSYIGMDTHKA